MTEHLALYSQMGYTEFDRRQHGDACLVYLRKSLSRSAPKATSDRLSAESTQRRA